MMKFYNPAFTSFSFLFVLFILIIGNIQDVKVTDCLLFNLTSPYLRAIPWKFSMLRTRRSFISGRERIAEPIMIHSGELRSIRVGVDSIPKRIAKACSSFTSTGLIFQPVSYLNIELMIIVISYF